MRHTTRSTKHVCIRGRNRQQSHLHALAALIGHGRAIRSRINLAYSGSHRHHSVFELATILVGYIAFAVSQLIDMLSDDGFNNI